MVYTTTNSPATVWPPEIRSASDWTRTERRFERWVVAEICGVLFFSGRALPAACSPSDLNTDERRKAGQLQLYEGYSLSLLFLCAAFFCFSQFLSSNRRWTHWHRSGRLMSHTRVLSFSAYKHCFPDIFFCYSEFSDCKGISVWRRVEVYIQYHSNGVYLVTNTVKIVLFLSLTHHTQAGLCTGFSC